MNLARYASAAVLFLTFSLYGAAVNCRAEEAVKALDEVCPVVFKGMALGDAASILGDTHNIRFAFADGVDKTTKIAYDARGKKLRVALNEILEPLKLGFAADGETITIGPAKKK
jgi:hypothetical protein